MEGTQTTHTIHTVLRDCKIVENHTMYETKYLPEFYLCVLLLGDEVLYRGR